MESSRVLGVDFGAKRIGLAVSDADRRVASPLALYERRSPQQDARNFRRLIEDEGVAAIVLGLPVHVSGAEGQKAREARAFGKWLRAATGLPVVFWDERFTTVEAERLLQDAGLTSQRRRARRDKVAAQLLLQSYLDAGCPGEQPPRPLEDAVE